MMLTNMIDKGGCRKLPIHKWGKCDIEDKHRHRQNITSHHFQEAEQDTEWTPQRHHETHYPSILKAISCTQDNAQIPP